MFPASAPHVSLIERLRTAPDSENLVNERKFVGHRVALERAIALLDAWCVPDPEHPVGHIFSIYFDSPRLDAYDEKANGDNIKRKIRIRWYGESAGRAIQNSAGADSDPEVPVFIESKGRVGSARRKFRVDTRAPARWISSVDLADPSLPDFLRREAAAADIDVPVGWVPSVCISYLRRRYVCPRSGCRVSIDWEIEAARANTALLPFLTTVRLPQVVCEFKRRGGNPPPWSANLCDEGFRLVSFSKYGTCIELIREGHIPL